MFLSISARVRAGTEAGARARTEFELSFLSVCVCVFFAGLNISLDLVEPIQRHRLELGVAESEIEFKTCCGSGKNRCEE